MLMVLDLLNTAQHLCSAMPDQTAPDAQHYFCPESTPGKQLLNIVH
jgi:hypothetical protein